MSNNLFFEIPQIIIKPINNKTKITDFDLDTTVINFKLDNNEIDLRTDLQVVSKQELFDKILKHLYELISDLYLCNEMLIKKLIDQLITAIINSSGSLCSTRVIIDKYDKVLAYKIYEQLKLYMNLEFMIYGHEIVDNQLIKILPINSIILSNRQKSPFAKAKPFAFNKIYTNFSKGINQEILFNNLYEFTLALILEHNSQEVLKWALIDKNKTLLKIYSDESIGLNFVAETETSKYVFFPCIQNINKTINEKNCIKVLDLWCNAANTVQAQKNDKVWSLIVLEASKIRAHFKFSDLLEFQYQDYKLI